jgi:hypothetical protein
MATNREMLKEAIADAKAVKETAIANAKSALEEAFTPQLKSMFAAKLQEMESEEDEMNEIEGFGDFDTKDNAGFSKMGEKALDEKMHDEDMMEVDLEELLAELNEEEDMDESLNEAEEGEEEDMEMSDEESEESEEEGEPIDLEDLTDEDLKDMIEDVIKDMIEKGELEAGHEGEEGEESEESEEEDEVIDLAELLKEIEEMDYMDEEKEPMDEIDLGGVDQTTAALATALPFLIGAGALFGTYLKFKLKGKSSSEQAKITKDILANPEKYKAEAEATKSQLGEMEGKEELDEFYAGGASVDPVMGAYAMGIFGAVFSTIIASVYRSFKKDEKLKSMKDSDVAKMAAKDKEFQASPEAQQTLKGEAEELAADAKMNIAESSKLNEALKTINVLKSELNEINLLNAKLLYTNKIFKSKNLNESQKVKVLTSFDKAKNVGEVKMVFETLNEGIKVSKNIIKENLGRASKGTMTPNVNKPIVESNEAFARMQKLAGII